MNDIFEQIMTTCYGMWRRRWFGLGAMWLVCVVGWSVIAYIPDRFISQARVYIDTNTLLPRLVQSVDVNPMAQVDMMRQTLVSRPNIEKVIHRVDLDLDVKDERQMEALVTELQQNISLRSQGENLFWIAYESGRPELSDQKNAELAKRVVQNLLTIFFEGNLGGMRNTLSETRRFIDEQLADYERQLEQAERRKAEFERQYMGFLPGEQNFFERSQSLQQRLAKLDDEIQDTTVVRVELERQLASLSPKIDDASARALAPGTGPYAQRLFSMQQQLDALYLRGFTDQHPDIVGVKRQMEMLRDQAANDASALSDVRSAAVNNPVYEDVRIKLVDAETKLASLHGLKTKLEKERGDLREKADTVPNIEAERARLNRDYGILRSQYEKLITSREQARLAQDVDTKTDKVQFRVIDPPEVPHKPSAPNRPLLLGGVLIAGLAAGISMAFVMSHIQVTYPTQSRLQTAFGLPVLGSVSAVISEQGRRQQRLEAAVFALVFSALFITCALLIVIEMTQKIVSA